MRAQHVAALVEAAAREVADVDVTARGEFSHGQPDITFAFEHPKFAIVSPVRIGFQMQSGQFRLMAILPHLGIPIGLDGLVEVSRDERLWRIGTAAEAAWIANPPILGWTINTAIPAVFEAYATVHQPESPDITTALHEQALLRDLADHTPDQRWWLGFLETGAHDVVFDRVPRVSLYWDWNYVLVEAGPEQALTWRTGHMRSADGVLPDLFFPADRSWLVSALWDDTWTCIGGSASLIETLQHDPLVRGRPVRLDEDATPPWHEHD